ncbi:MAG: DUF5320 domain-containing protein [Halothermotrichaceae bacterium]
MLKKKGDDSMPAGDRTGPQGEGPMTGRGLGNCADGSGNAAANNNVRPRRYLAYRRGAGNGRKGGGSFRRAGGRGRGRR